MRFPKPWRPCRSPAPNIHPCHICAGTEHPPLPHLRRDWLTPAIIMPSRGRPLPRVHRDWARPPDDVIAGGRSFGADTRELAFRDAQYPLQYPLQYRPSTAPCTALYPTPNSLYAAEYCVVPPAAPSHRTRDGRAHCLALPAIHSPPARPHRNGCQRYSYWGTERAECSRVLTSSRIRALHDGAAPSEPAPPLKLTAPPTCLQR
jgi:hypothetical protein